jgi:4-amino-4-deoxy-L-arabinose transferase-like glycosyltransferase
MPARATRRFLPILLAIVAAGAVLRGAWLTADPPWFPTVGVVWHDEGAWVHNARNKALFGAWRLDDWNPVYVAPVFTALEYASFEAFGVGTRQARLVSVAAGVLSIALLGLGVRRVAGSLAGLSAAAFLATNFDYVMYDRAATMEGLMAALIVASWWASTRAEDRPAWGAAAGALATAAYFTKAAAAFYVAALGLAAVWGFLRPPEPSEAPREQHAALWTLAGLAVSFALVTALFVLPHWSEYRYYNWQISVTRKPSYDFHALETRASWLPVLHDVLSRAWLLVVVAIFGAWSILLRWRTARTSERLLLLWVLVGVAELVVHDVGNERRFVVLIPALAALTGVVLGRCTGLLPPEARAVAPRRAWLFAPAVLYSAYVVCGPVARLAFLYDVKDEVRLAAALAAALGTCVLVWWERVSRWLSMRAWTPRAAAVLAAIAALGALVPYGHWAAHRTFKNYETSVAIGRVLPSGTLVQGKLANGLALENRIRPLFIGHGFGNFSDRKHRPDVRYILTYTAPALGYEGSQIRDVLDAYPGWHIIMSFDVAETPSGHDRAALIEKRALD